jgi:predicted nuclease of predicted toxin-antitoxin system
MSATCRLLLDEMLGYRIVEQLEARGHDVASVVADRALMSLPDEAVLAEATRLGRVLVTLNVKDFLPLDARWRAGGRAHAGIVLISTRTFPQDRSFVGAVVTALDKLLGEPDSVGPEQVVFLGR